MAIILNADVVIAGEKGHFDLQRWLVSHAAEQFEIAAITVAELWHGVERATGMQRSRRQHYLNTILSLLPVIPYTEQTAYEHARIWAEAEEQGKMIGAYDLILAAIASERGSRLATFNKRHFSKIAGLTILTPI